jgi:hypothetical protein
MGFSGLKVGLTRYSTSLDVTLRHKSGTGTATHRAACSTSAVSASSTSASRSRRRSRPTPSWATWAAICEGVAAPPVARLDHPSRAGGAQTGLAADREGVGKGDLAPPAVAGANDGREGGWVVQAADDAVLDLGEPLKRPGGRLAGHVAARCE